jgi:hypothetical protein
MGAGDGTADQSRLASERVARLKRQLDQAEGSTRAWDAGAPCERAVAEKLSELVPRGWYLLHDVHWPGRPKANLDHVLVGPGGVVVVDAKNWTGEVRVASGVLWQGRYARTQAVEGALAQCAAVASVMAPPHRRLVRPLICMAAQPDLFGVTNSDVAVAGTERVLAAIEALPPVLDQQAVVGIYAQLGQQLTHEQEPGITALRSVRPGTVVKPAGPDQSPSETGGTPPPETSEAPPLGPPRPVPARSVSGRGNPSHPRPSRRASHAGVSSGRVPPRAAGGANLSNAAAGSRNSNGREHGTGSGRLALLAAFVIFAVYVLPYLGR